MYKSLYFVHRLEFVRKCLQAVTPARDKEQVVAPIGQLPSNVFADSCRGPGYQCHVLDCHGICDH